MFHGTLLYDSDLDMLEKSLKGDESKRGKKIASVRSEVTNIRQHMAEKLPVKDFFTKLIEGSMEYFSVENYELLSGSLPDNEDMP